MVIHRYGGSSTILPLVSLPQVSMICQVADEASDIEHDLTRNNLGVSVIF